MIHEPAGFDRLIKPPLAVKVVLQTRLAVSMRRGDDDEGE
jgi:hypothetical protein